MSETALRLAIGQPSAVQLLAQDTILLVRCAAESNGGGGGS